MWETQVQSLGRKDLLEKEMATHSSILAGKSHGQRNLVGCSPWGPKESDTAERLHGHRSLEFPCSLYVISLWFCIQQSEDTES